MHGDKADKIFNDAMPDRHEMHDLEDIDEYAEVCMNHSDEWKDLPEFNEKKHLQLLKDRYNFS